MWRDPRCSFRGETGMSGNFLSCMNVVMDPLEIKREGGISLKMLQRKRASSSVEWRISWCFSSFFRKHGVPLEIRRGPHELTRVATGSSRVKMGTSRTSSCGLRKGQSPCELQGASQDSSPVCAGSKVLFWSQGQNLRFPLHCYRGAWGSSGASTGESGLVSSGDMHVHFPPKL